MGRLLDGSMKCWADAVAWWTNAWWVGDVLASRHVNHY